MNVYIFAILYIVINRVKFQGVDIFVFVGGSTGIAMHQFASSYQVSVSTGSLLITITVFANKKKLR